MLNVTAKLVREAHHFMATDDARHYICGVLIDTNVKGGGVSIVATNGHSMFVGHDPAGSVSAPTILKLPKEGLAAIDKRLKVRGTEGSDVRLRSDSVKPGRQIAYVDLQTPQGFVNAWLGQGEIVDGTFPDWRRILPDMRGDYTVEGYQAAYLGLFGKVAKSIKVFGFDGGPAFIHLVRDDAFAVLMPYQHAGDAKFPDWI